MALRLGPKGPSQKFATRRATYRESGDGESAFSAQHDGLTQALITMARTKRMTTIITASRASLRTGGLFGGTCAVSVIDLATNRLRRASSVDFERQDLNSKF